MRVAMECDRSHFGVNSEGVAPRMLFALRGAH